MVPCGGQGVGAPEGSALLVTVRPSELEVEGRTRFVLLCKYPLVCFEFCMCL